MPATIFASSKVKALKDTLSLNGGADVITSTTDPTTSSVDALRGSLLLNTSNGEIYRKLDDGNTTNWQIVGSSGAGGINYIENPIAEANTSGWATYADAAASRPVDGTGGSPTVTWTRVTSSPLRGIGSFLFTKDAANRQGQGVSYDYTIDSADQARVLQITFDYEIASGTYSGGTPSTDSDLIVYMYRTTATGRLIEPSVIKLDGAVAGVKYSYRGEIQADSDATGYRLIIHVATTSASAYTVKMDNFIVGPSKNVAGSITTQWTAYTPTVAGLGTGSGTATGFWRRAGDSAEFQVNFIKDGSGGSGAAEVTFSIPGGLVMDATRLANSGTNLNLGVALTNGVESATVFDTHSVVYQTTTTVKITNDGNNLYMAGSDFRAASVTNMTFKAPIVGWGATATLGQDADTRVVGFSARAASATVSGSASSVSWSTVESDTHGGFDGVDDYTIRVAGWYRVYSQMRIDGTYAANQVASVYIRVNGSDKVQGQDRAGGSITALYPNVTYQGYFNSGDTIRIMVDSSATTPTINSGTTVSWFSITRESGPAQVAASEVVACKLRLPSNQTISGSSAALDISTVVFDTHGAADTANDRYRVPVSGYYRVSCGVIGNAVTAAQSVSVFITVNSVSRCTRNEFANSSLEICVTADDVFLLNSGDLVAVTVGSVDTSWTVVGGTEADSTFSITRVGGI